jgi:hypothetical protein
VSIILWHWDPTVAAWTVAAARGYDHNTYGDHSEDYYTPWVCDADYPGLDKWYTKTVELRAVSWSGQQGSPHDHQSYQAEINPC